MRRFLNISDVKHEALIKDRLLTFLEKIADEDNDV